MANCVQRTARAAGVPLRTAAITSAAVQPGRASSVRTAAAISCVAASAA